MCIVHLMQAYFLDTYAVDGACKIARKLSSVILNLSFEMLEDEFFYIFG